MINIIDKKECTGCTACEQSCPVKCIKMLPDEEGFMYPQVNEDLCINCGKCDKVCPVQNGETILKKEFPNAYLIYDKDKDWRVKSAAGGGFGALARLFIEKYNGVVFGAIYDSDYTVYHHFTDTISKLENMQKSKYVQSELRDSFSYVQKYLNEGRYVLFTGTPCQIYGLKSYLGSLSQEKLYCIDLSCHGVPSPKVFKKYLNFLEIENKSKIDKFVMRDKKVSKNKYEQGFGITFKNNNKQFNSHTKDLFGKCFWGEIASRPSCYSCEFKTVWRISDITLGDCWFFNCFIPNEKDDLGVTMALTHTNKGLNLINECIKLKSYEVDCESLVKANGGMIYSSAIENENRNLFFEELDKLEFKELVSKYFPEKKLGKKQTIIRFIDKSGIQLECLRKISRRKKLNERLKREIPKNKLGVRVLK